MERYSKQQRREWKAFRQTFTNTSVPAINDEQLNQLKALERRAKRTKNFFIVREEQTGEPGVRWFGVYKELEQIAALIQTALQDPCAEDCIFIEGNSLPPYIKRAIINQIQKKYYEEDYR